MEGQTENNSFDMSAKDYPSAPLGTKSVLKLPVRDFSVSVSLDSIQPDDKHHVGIRKLSLGKAMAK